MQCWSKLPTACRIFDFTTAFFSLTTAQINTSHFSFCKIARPSHCTHPLDSGSCDSPFPKPRQQMVQHCDLDQSMKCSVLSSTAIQSASRFASCAVPRRPV